MLDDPYGIQWQNQVITNYCSTSWPEVANFFLIIDELLHMN